MLRFESAEDGADWAGIAPEDFQRECDEFVVSCGDVIETESFEDLHVVAGDGGVSGEVFGVLEIDAGRVDADGDDAAELNAGFVVGDRESGEVLNQFGRECGEVVGPLFEGGEG